MDRLSRPASPAGGYARRGGAYAHHGGRSAQTSPGGSPTASPVHRHARAGSLGGAGAASTVGRRGRAQNTAARAAAQRLARVMASTDGAGGGGGVGAGGDGGSGSEDDEYELSGPPIELSSTPRRTATRSPSPSIGRYLADQAPVSRPPSLTNRYMAGKAVPMIPSIKQQSRPATSGAGSESPVVNRREQRRSVDLGSSMRGRRTSSSLHDEINTLQVENETMYEKFNLAEERSEDGDVKSMHMAAVIGDAIEPEANLISRKDAALEQRKDALRIASRKSNSASCDEIATLRSEAKVVNSVASSVSQHVKSAGSDLRSFQGAANRMILSQEEMEEVVLKRCWLARYWKLSVRLGIHSDIAEEKQEYWSSFAPLALEVVLSIGQKARDGKLSDNADMEIKSKMSDASHLNDMPGDGNIESMLLVERGLRELASLKVEDAIMLALAEHRRIKPLSGPLIDPVLFSYLYEDKIIKSYYVFLTYQQSVHRE
ncbi:hypothetical protein GUJ93_ZPchr0010g7546 [Zizania palustris]|uniref:Uncharacterized protein n=1 Tax=Zizania palustris TaxID=103762 RepID=A0A8J5W7R9_ZIZPA|nr:hypothetical protein GUJ93_ZPchr0010g7546 [Zizania palustris]